MDTLIAHGYLAQYLYLGPSTVIRITYPQPGIWLDLWGGTSGVFTGIDQFGRIIDQRWQNNITGTPTDIDRYKYGYDQNSNRLYKANVVGAAAVATGLDEFYVYDPLNRLTEMQRGVLNGTNTGITGTPSVEQDWTLDPTGNWGNFVTSAVGTTTLNQTRTANAANEITNITESTGPTWIVPAYDAAGNTITMPQVVDPIQRFTAIYDAWNRMVSINLGSTSIGAYQYDGRNFRAVKLTYTSGVLSETRHFYYTPNWQDIEERVGSDATIDRQHVWGIRYIDELVCRDDATPERLYAAQDANFSVTSVSNTIGAPVERYLFDPYGDRTVMNAAWTVIGSSAYNWAIGQQGLIHDPESDLVFVRWRCYHPTLGTWVGRDPITASNLYEYLRTNPARWMDPTGLDCCGPDVTTWFVNDLSLVASNLVADANELGDGLGVGSAQLLQFRHTAKYLAYKWLKYNSSGCATGQCNDTVELSHVCVRKDELGNIGFGFLAAIAPPPGFDTAGAVSFAYNGIFGYGAVDTWTTGSLVGTLRIDNLAAFSIGTALAASGLHGGVIALSAAMSKTSIYSGLIAGGYQIAPSDLTLSSPFSGTKGVGFDTSTCTSCKKPWTGPSSVAAFRVLRLEYFQTNPTNGPSFDTWLMNQYQQY